MFNTSYPYCGKNKTKQNQFCMSKEQAQRGSTRVATIDKRNTNIPHFFHYSLQLPCAIPGCAVTQQEMCSQLHPSARHEQQTGLCAGTGRPEPEALGSELAVQTPIPRATPQQLQAAGQPTGPH